MLAVPTARASSRSTALRRHSRPITRSEEHTSELQSHLNLVCRLLLEKKKNKKSQETLRKPDDDPNNRKISECKRVTTPPNQRQRQQQPRSRQATRKCLTRGEHTEHLT